MRKAIFIDRDGTLIKDVPYNADPRLIQFEFFAIEILQWLKKKNYLVIVISNQSGVAKGYFSENDVHEMHETIQQKLKKYNVQLDGFYYCPHFPEGIVEEFSVECDCRKPKPGLILKAAKDFCLDINQSWMIGDILNDVEAGKTAGCKTILINNGNETEWILNAARMPAHIVRDLKQAAEIIAEHELASV